MTVGDVIKKAMLLIGAVDRFGEPTANEYSDGIISLNQMLRRLGVDRHNMHTAATVTKVLTASDGIYTIGATGDIVTTRPHKILTATVTVDSQEYTLEELSRAEYRAISDKTTASIPAHFMYEPTATNGTIYLYPYPDSTYTLNLTLQQPITEYTATSQTIGLPEEYLAHLPWGLAIDLSPEYGVQPSQTVVARADETLTSLKRLHVQVARVFTDPLTANNREFDITIG